MLTKQVHEYVAGFVRRLLYVIAKDSVFPPPELVVDEVSDEVVVVLVRGDHLSRNLVELVLGLLAEQVQPRNSGLTPHPQSQRIRHRVIANPRQGVNVAPAANRVETPGAQSIENRACPRGSVGVIANGSVLGLFSTVPVA